MSTEAYGNPKTLQDVVQRLMANPGFSDIRKRDLRSAVVVIGKLIGQPLAAIPLDLAVLRQTLDALVPALTALRAAPPGDPIESVLARAAEAAEAGAAATIPLVARKGRASYLGERSAGHLDPGAASSAILVRCLADVVAAARGGGMPPSEPRAGR